VDFILIVGDPAPLREKVLPYHEFEITKFFKMPYNLHEISLVSKPSFYHFDKNTHVVESACLEALKL